MSSSKKNIFIALLLLLIPFAGCKKKSTIPVNLENKKVVKNIARELLGEDVRFSTSGYFTSDSALTIVAGVEASERYLSGIQFKLIDDIDGEFTVIYSTPVLEGSFDKCVLDKMKLYRNTGELIYYNSQDYFMGTGGGEVFSYIIDFTARQVYSAHLMVEPRSGAVLFLSENIKQPMLRKFFVSYFKKDYPNLRVVAAENI